MRQTIRTTLNFFNTSIIPVLLTFGTFFAYYVSYNQKLDKQFAETNLNIVGIKSEIKLADTLKCMRLSGLEDRVNKLEICKNGH